MRRGLTGVNRVSLVSVSVPKNLDPRDALYIELVTRRSEAVSEEDIASALGFESPKELYRRLAWAGFPICAGCGTVFATEEHCKQAQAERRRERSALFVGGTINMLLPEYATRLMTELAAIGLDPDRRREAWELKPTPGPDRGQHSDVKPLRPAVYSAPEASRRSSAGRAAHS